MKKEEIMSMRKGEMSMEIIVIAVLALLFLVIVAAVMTGKFSIFSKTLSDCTNKEGKCFPGKTCTYGIQSDFTCTENEVCCLNTCEGKNGKCLTKEECNAPGKTILYTAACTDSTQTCCR